jgi:hypothetical protein
VEAITLEIRGDYMRGEPSLQGRRGLDVTSNDALIDAHGFSRHFHLTAGATLELIGVHLTGGVAWLGDGGAVLLENNWSIQPAFPHAHPPTSFLARPSNQPSLAPALPRTLQPTLQPAICPSPPSSPPTTQPAFECARRSTKTLQLTN